MRLKKIKYALKAVEAVTRLAGRIADFVSEAVGEFLRKHYIVAVAIVIICVIIGGVI